MPKQNFIILIFLFPLIVYSQIEIDTTISIERLVNKTLISENSGFKIENINYTGARQSIGFFSNASTKIVKVEKGIILSTGNVYDAIGPNNSPNIGSKTIDATDLDLEKIAKEKTHDAVVLEFDFIPLMDSITFRFFFASEEYPEYTNRGINDIFGFFISNKELGINKNLAVLNDGKTPVSIDNINAIKNSEYYIANGQWDENNILKWKNNKDLGELVYTFQYDGFTKVMNVGEKVLPNQKYHIKFAIADVADRIFDSAIFLDAGSFRCVDSRESKKQQGKPFFNE